MKIRHFSHIRERIMSLVKYAGVSLIAMSASMGHAGGVEDAALSAGFMFEDGSYGSVSVKSQSPSVKATQGGASVTTGSLVGSVTSTNIKAKMDVLDNMSVGITYYRQAGIKLDYQGNWTGAPAAAVLPKVDLDITALAVLLKYDFNENVSVLGGLKNGTTSDATVSIPASSVTATSTGKSALSYIAGAAYEIPEIALRAELMYETSAAYSLPTAFSDYRPLGGAFPGDPAGKLNASTPDYINIYVQSGIAEDTLAYASARQANWKTNQVSMKHIATRGNDDAQALGTPKDLSDFSDTTSYEIGLGRKFGTTWSSSISYNWEGGSGPTTTSMFTLSDGRQGISVGAKYNFSENTAITVGGNYTDFGKVTNTATTAVLSGNTATTLGVSLSTSF
jgi:long-subunit fatty acid transport protein